MADLDRVKRNISRMISMNAPEADIDGYIASEGVTLEQVRAHKIGNQTSTQDKSLSWSEVPGKAWDNLGQSAVDFGAAIVQPFTDPKAFVGGVKDLAVGAGSKVVAGADAVGQAVGLPQLPRMDPETRAINERGINAAGQFFKDRYGSVDALKNTLATDPVGAAADTAMVLYGGGATLPGRAGAAVKAAGSAIDPIKNAGRLAKGVGVAAREGLGLTTGAGALPVEQAFKAGRQGNKTFTDNMRGNAQMSDTLDMANRGVDSLVKERSNQFKAWNPLPGSKATIDLKPLDKAVADGMNIAFYKGQKVDTAAADVMTKVKKAVDTFKANGMTSPEDLNTLKQIVYDIGGEAKQGSRAHKAAMGIYHSIGDELKAQVPGYAETMKDYGTASDLIKEMRRTLSLNDKATADTKMRKLQSVMRNNVNTNYGARTRLVDELAKREPNLPAALAGQAMSSFSPRGIQSGILGAGLGGAAGYAAMTNPTTLAGLLATGAVSSPRLVGEAAYLAGQGARAADKVGRAIPITAEQAARALMLGQLLSRSTQTEE